MNSASDDYLPFGRLTGLHNDVFVEEHVFRGLVESESECNESFWPRNDACSKNFVESAKLVSHVDLCINETAGPFAPSASLEEVAYVEPHSSFFSSHPPHQVLYAVCGWLASICVDFEAEPSLYKIDAISRAGVALCSFCFRAYRTQEEVVFELQRKQGCVVFFYSLWTQLAAALGNLINEPRWPQIDLDAPTGFSDIPPPLAFGGSASLTLNAPVVLSLLNMLDSPHLDVQIEAVRALAAAVDGEASNVHILCETFAQPGAPTSQLVQKLADALVHDELARDSAVLLAAITSYQPSSILSCSSIFSSLKSVLSTPSTVCNRDAKRRVLTILSLLATKLPKQDILDALDLISRDLCLRNIAHQVFVAVEACT